jgi:hypothetical protein
MTTTLVSFHSIVYIVDQIPSYHRHSFNIDYSLFSLYDHDTRFILSYTYLTKSLHIIDNYGTLDVAIVSHHVTRYVFYMRFVGRKLDDGA